MKTCEWVLALTDEDPGITCGKSAAYLVALPGSGFVPSCHRHMVHAIVQTTAHEYKIHRPGHRDPVQVLPADQR